MGDFQLQYLGNWHLFLKQDESQSQLKLLISFKKFAMNTNAGPLAVWMDDYYLIKIVQKCDMFDLASKLNHEHDQFILLIIFNKYGRGTPFSIFGGLVYTIMNQLAIYSCINHNVNGNCLNFKLKLVDSNVRYLKMLSLKSVHKFDAVVIESEGNNITIGVTAKECQNQLKIKKF